MRRILMAVTMALLSAVPGAQAANDPSRAAILDAARAPVVKEFARPIRFVVKRLRRDGDWAFLLATMQNVHGRPISYVGTSLADADAHGMVSHDYAALLRHEHDHWKLVTYAIGPSDEVWDIWPTEHGAPPALFAR